MSKDNNPIKEQKHAKVTNRFYTQRASAVTLTIMYTSLRAMNVSLNFKTYKSTKIFFLNQDLRKPKVPEF